MLLQFLRRETGRLYSSLVPQLVSDSSDHVPSNGRSISVCSSVALVLLSLALVYHYWNGVYLGRHYPYNTFLFVPEDRFSDYWDMLKITRNLNPYVDSTRSQYPPLANLVYYELSLLPKNLGFAIFLGVPLLISCFLLKNAMRNVDIAHAAMAIITLFLLSYPLLNCLDRANMELWIYVLVAFFAFNFESRNSQLRELSLYALSVAAALKLFPILLALLLAKEKRWRDMFVVVGFAATASFASACCFVGGPSKALHDWLAVWRDTGNTLVTEPRFGRNNVGFFYLLYYSSLLLGWSKLAVVAVRYGSLMSLLLLGLLSCGVLFCRITVASAFIVLTAGMCLFPSLSYDYRLIHLTVPLFMILNKGGRWSAGRWTEALILCVLLAPKAYFVLFKEVDPQDVRSNSLVNPLLLIVVAFVALVVDSKVVIMSSKTELPRHLNQVPS